MLLVLTPSVRKLVRATVGPPVISIICVVPCRYLPSVGGTLPLTDRQLLGSVLSVRALVVGDGRPPTMVVVFVRCSVVRFKIVRMSKVVVMGVPFVEPWR